ncbi:twin-arginine translocase TatA/TatE family subunit [Marivibrio halodurans]|uniref:Sec-independent protein translocase protein TatA n=1 Tax=Marivibrio halodurans TaxID=2039722 RepID=A0A8J7V3N5_9PROT|nr:twin-arginine translocase TatA/TatE family subunit [Marivibrio halodurans]MBP5856924.1 twin-arginine translocase TatA/TatE family subunit [Marivibrio halodurans]
MGTFSIWHWLIVLAVVLLLFGGRGKISQIMGDFGKGLKSFKSNVKDDASDENKDEEQSTKRIAEDETSGSTQSETKQDKAANG